VCIAKSVRPKLSARYSRRWQHRQNSFSLHHQPLGANRIATGTAFEQRQTHRLCECQAQARIAYAGDSVSPRLLQAKLIGTTVGDRPIQDLQRGAQVLRKPGTQYRAIQLGMAQLHRLCHPGRAPEQSFEGLTLGRCQLAHRKLVATFTTLEACTQPCAKHRQVRPAQ
jgi:hypothetical protein